jgi:hypothetical protein
VDRVDLPTLDAPNRMAGVALIPSPVQVLGRGPERDDQVFGQVFRFGLTPLFVPQPNERGWIVTMMIWASDPPMNERRLGANTF